MKIKEGEKKKMEQIRGEKEEKERNKNSEEMCSEIVLAYFTEFCRFFLRIAVAIRGKMTEIK